MFSAPGPSLLASSSTLFLIEDTEDIEYSDNTIVVNTNSYALTKNASAFGRRWQNLTCKELIIWIALVIYQGLFKSLSFEQYWNEDTRFPLHHISRQMTLKCFKQIMRYLHISSPAEMINHYFEKLKPLLSHYLWQIGISACGTVRKTASGFPKKLKVNRNIKLNWDVHSGIIINKVMAVFWQDNGPVTMLTMVHSLVGDKWEIMHERIQGSTKKHKEFHHELVWELINLANNSVLQSSVVSGNHFVKWRKEKREVCQWCSWLANKQKLEMNRKSPNQSNFWYVECDVPLCCNAKRNCFLEFHINN
ncbi:10211_t:CDS:2 [Cetraspora pellucida]|uniref:10211_t:CDS:1 n=1 Tax=Cetraspora pellucida TaxID=1433469 RepID=A0A9N9P684_9GLOM|nr:10211_t:CDS:2 [Cetraspora pellucida]